ncbi:COMM domain-containing protein 5 [Armadillidium nasatum]|uniref:COMM domain-containing protein 5 n=1 Tax=Armadillidium nasatum TaxID=96803 RepID=A0A5N5TDS6_9CRUS|nr:COMM domain-containing protein 5 [Armadillidium nasatum]
MEPNVSSKVKIPLLKLSIKMNSKYPKSDKIKSNKEIKASEYWQERAVFPLFVPNEVKYLIENILEFDKGFFRKLLKGTMSHEQCEHIFHNLCKAKQCSDDEDVLKLSIAYSGVVSLLRAVLKINMKTVRESTLQKDLIGLGIPEDLASDVCKIVFGPAHSNIMREIVANNPHLPKLEAFNWSVDVTLSNNWSSKVLEPLCEHDNEDNRW